MPGSHRRSESSWCGWSLQVLVTILISQCCSCGVLRPHHQRKGDDAEASATNPASLVATSPDDLTPGVAPAGIEAESTTDFAGFTPSGSSRPALTGWKRSATEAIHEARSNGRPIIVAATNQQIETSQQFESTLLASRAFRDVTDGAFVFLLLDYGDKETLKSDFYRDFKTRLNLRGYPTLLVVLPDGQEIIRLKGYLPEWKNRYIQSIKDSIPHAAQAAAYRRKKMESTGYRLWGAPNGEKIFAKLIGVDANQATFTGEWGGEFRTFITRLSEADQEWISKQRR